MKIQFCFNGNVNGGLDIVAEFDVAEVPTEKQCKLIDEYILEVFNRWEDEDDDVEEFDYWGLCFEAARKYLKLVPNPVVKTFYL